jgi:hypothetical protein
LQENKTALHVALSRRAGVQARVTRILGEVEAHFSGMESKKFWEELIA